MNAEKFLQKLRNGGQLVSSNDCTAEQIAWARSEGRLYVDDEGFGYVFVPAPKHNVVSGSAVLKLSASALVIAFVLLFPFDAIGQETAVHHRRELQQHTIGFRRTGILGFGILPYYRPLRVWTLGDQRGLPYRGDYYPHPGVHPERVFQHRQPFSEPVESVVPPDRIDIQQWNLVPDVPPARPVGYVPSAVSSVHDRNGSRFTGGRQDLNANRESYRRDFRSSRPEGTH